MNRRRPDQDVVCQQLVEMVTDYLEGELDPVDRAAVEAHLAQCEHCGGYVQQVRRMLALTAQRRDEPVVVPEDLVRALTAHYRSR